MPVFNSKFDEYIAKSAPFAQPILTHIRELIHKACPDIVETIKWGFPHFEYKGNVCGMAAFKQHCAFNFWKGSIMQDPQQILTITERESMGHLGTIKSLQDLPADKILIAYIKQAVKLNEDNIKIAAKPKAAIQELEVPDYFTKALKKNKAAQKVFDAFSYSSKKEYVEWITGAKAEATRDKRMSEAIEWIAEGKTRHWKYKK